MTQSFANLRGPLGDGAFPRVAVISAGVVLVALTGCSSAKQTSSPPTKQRPATNARLHIISPQPNQETGPEVNVDVRLIGAREVERTGPPITPDEGHIHISVDGATVAMAYGDNHVLTGLTPGPHTVQVDFVAADHVPFSNRVNAAVIFTVK